MNKVWGGIGAKIGLTALVLGVSGGVQGKSHPKNNTLSIQGIHRITISHFNNLISEKKIYIPKESRCVLSELQNKKRVKLILACDGDVLDSKEVKNASSNEKVIQIINPKLGKNRRFNPSSGCLILEANGKQKTDPNDCNKKDGELIHPPKKKRNIRA